MEVEKLKKRILALGAVVEEQVRRSVDAILKRDGELAAQVIRDDEEIDRTEVDIEEECLKILALYQPVAADLRFIVAILKINSDLERIGDLAVNIAQRAELLAGMEPDDPPFDLRGMAEKAQAMLKMSLDALVNRDAIAAQATCDADEEVDEANRRAYVSFVAAARERPARIGTLMPQFTAVRQIERIADHATNIAEDVMYMLKGEIVRHHPEKHGPGDPQTRRA